MLIALLILQAATLGVLVYVILQIKTIFREVRNPVVRQKGSLSAEFKDRLRNLPRPDGQNRDNRDGNRENRGDRGPRPEGNRENRDRGDRGDRGPRPEGNRENRDRGDRGPRPEGNRENRDRGDRGDRGPRPEGNRENRGDRPERAPRAEAPAAAAEGQSAPVEAVAAAPVFSGRRPLTHSSAPASSDSSVDSTPDALAPSSLAQPVTSDAPIRHGRRALPKVKPRFDDEGDDSSSDEKKEIAAI
ncbi:MAG TPA: hypothetical protein PK208_13990 [Fibrobacteria bacterium]|nr:hypothetical protein [Fibrobacteria bacterium]